MPGIFPLPSHWDFLGRLMLRFLLLSGALLAALLIDLALPAWGGSWGSLSFLWTWLAILTTCQTPVVAVFFAGLGGLASDLLLAPAHQGIDLFLFPLLAWSITLLPVARTLTVRCFRALLAIALLGAVHGLWTFLSGDQPPPWSWWLARATGTYLLAFPLLLPASLTRTRFAN